MIVLDCKQGSPEWHFARLGIPTASQFGRILTPKTRKFSESSVGYIHELIAEWLIGIPGGGEGRGFMERGTNMEEWGRGYYELVRGVTVQTVGVCLRDDRMAAASPDGLVGDDGGMEIKVPSASKHVANLLGAAEEHHAQVQGNLWITGRKWWDLVSYHPEIPPTIVHVERDEAYIEALDAAMSEFVPRLLAARERVVALGAVPAAALAPEFAATITEGA